MSLIGKNITFRSTVGSTYKEGVVLDKYRGYDYVKQPVASGQGGTITVSTAVTVDYYMVKNKEGKILHVLCSDVV